MPLHLVNPAQGHLHNGIFRRRFQRALGRLVAKDEVIVRLYYIRCAGIDICAFHRRTERIETIRRGTIDRSLPVVGDFCAHNLRMELDVLSVRLDGDINPVPINHRHGHSVAKFLVVAHDAGGAPCIAAVLGLDDGDVLVGQTPLIIRRLVGKVNLHCPVRKFEHARLIAPAQHVLVPDSGIIDILYGAPCSAGIIGGGDGNRVRSEGTSVFYRTNVCRIDDASGMVRIVLAQLRELGIGNDNLGRCLIVAVPHCRTLRTPARPPVRAELETSVPATRIDSHISPVVQAVYTRISSGSEKFCIIPIDANLFKGRLLR